MHQNPFLTTPDVQKYLFWKKVFGGLEVCANASKHVFNHSRRSKIYFLINFCCCLEVCIKTRFNHSRRSKTSLLKNRFWWSGSMRKCIKTRFYPLQTFKNIFFEKKILVVWKYSQMHQNTFLTSPDGQKYLFSEHFSAGLEVCEYASKHHFNPPDVQNDLFWKKFLVV